MEDHAKVLSVTGWWMNTESWTTRAGAVVPLERLSPSHRENIIAMIHSRSVVRRLRSVLGYFALLAPANYIGFDYENDDVLLADPFSEYMDWLDSASDDEIVNSLPLVKRLVELNAAEGSSSPG